jgi:hypothetical protein
MWKALCAQNKRVGGVEVEETHFMCDEKYILKRVK